MAHRIRVSPIDRIFSQLIRRRDRYTCQRCGTHHAPNSQGLHAAHLFSRGRYSTRWHPSNVHALCYGCHAYIDRHPHEKIAWGQAHLGPDLYETIRQLSEQPAKMGQVARKAIYAKLKAAWVAGDDPPYY